MLELPAGEQHAQVLDGLGHLVKGVRDVVGIGQGDVAPDLIRAAGEAQQIAQTAAREQQGQPRLVGFLARHCCQGHRDQLGQVRHDRRGPVVRFRVKPERLRAQRLEQRNKTRHTRVVGPGRSSGICARCMRIAGISCLANERVLRPAKQFRIGMRDAANLPPRHRMAAQESRRAAEALASNAAYFRLCAARISDQRARVGAAGNFGQ